MRREVKSPHLGMRLLPFRYTQGTGFSSVLNSGAFSLTDSATGSALVSLTKPGRRRGIFVASPGTDIADGGYIAADVSTAAPTNVVVGQIESFNASGSADDGTVYGFAVTYDNADTKTLGTKADRSGCFPVYTNVKNNRLMGFYVDGTGTASIVVGSHDAVLTDNSTGNYTLTFTEPFGCDDVVVAGSPITSTGRLTIESVDATSVNIKTFSNSGSASDLDFQLLVFGVESSYWIPANRVPLLTTQRDCRLLAFEADNAGATNLGVGDGTTSDGGTGDYTTTIATPFARVPIAVTIADALDSQLGQATTASTVRTRTSDAAGSHTDGKRYILVLGSDCADEY